MRMKTHEQSSNPGPSPAVPEESLVTVGVVPLKILIGAWYEPRHRFGADETAVLQACP